MPPKKGKGKARLNESPEERALRLQMEALAAEEANKQAEQAFRQGMIDKQKREQAYAHINAIKIHNQWRKIMRMAKVEELRKEIEILSQNHEREVDRKDAVIQMLERDLEEAEEQYQLAVRQHLMVVDSLLDLQYARMTAVEAQFASDLKMLEEDFETERADIVNAHNRRKKDLNDMNAAMEHEFSEAENELKQEFETQWEELKNKNSEDYNVLKLQLEGIIDELERHFEQAHRAYLESTEHRSKAFKALSTSDAAAAQVIEQKMKKLVKSQEQLQHWRLKIQANTRGWEERNRALRGQKELMHRHYGVLTGGLNVFRQQQFERLRVLAKNSAACTESLTTKLQKAEDILILAGMCRKMETEQEKVLPFYSQAVPDEAELSAELAEEQRRFREEQGSKASTSGQPGDARLTSFATDGEGKDVEEWDYLNNFFKKFNKALLDKAAVDRERARLEQENAELRTVLKQYLDGISVNDEILNNPLNPLLVVNQRLQLTLAERRKGKAAAADATGSTQASTPAAAPQLVVVNAVSNA